MNEEVFVSLKYSLTKVSITKLLLGMLWKTSAGLSICIHRSQNNEQEQHCFHCDNPTTQYSLLLVFQIFIQFYDRIYRGFYKQRLIVYNNFNYRECKGHSIFYV